MATYSARLITQEWMRFLKVFHDLESERTTIIEIIPDLMQDNPQHDGKSLVLLSTSDDFAELLDASFTEGLLYAYGWNKEFKKHTDGKAEEKRAPRTQYAIY